MDMMDAIGRRYSCRAYDPKPVEEEKLHQIQQAARLAPSARNFQDWRFVVVTDPCKRKEMMAAACNQPFVGQAPAVIAACSTSRHVMRCGHPVGPVDVSIALVHIALAATSLGLATCWVGAFSPDKVRQILNIPTEVTVVSLMTLGYPADSKKQPNRLPADQIFCREEWSF